METKESRVFSEGQTVHVYDASENYAGFDAIVTGFHSELDGEEFYEIEAPNGDHHVLSEMRLGDA